MTLNKLKKSIEDLKREISLSKGPLSSNGVEEIKELFRQAENRGPFIDKDNDFSLFEFAELGNDPNNHIQSYDDFLKSKLANHGVFTPEYLKNKRDAMDAEYYERRKGGL